MEGEKSPIPKIGISGINSQEFQASFLALIAQILMINNPDHPSEGFDSDRIISSSASSPIPDFTPPNNSLITALSPLLYPSPDTTGTHNVKGTENREIKTDLEYTPVSIEDLTNINSLRGVMALQRRPSIRPESVPSAIAFDKPHSIEKEISKPMGDTDSSPLENDHPFPEVKVSFTDSQRTDGEHTEPMPDKEIPLVRQGNGARGSLCSTVDDRATDAESIYRKPVEPIHREPIEQIKGVLSILKTEIRTEQGDKLKATDSQRSGYDTSSTQGDNNLFTTNVSTSNGSSLKVERPADFSRVSVAPIYEHSSHESDSSAIRVTVEHDRLGELDIKLVLDRGVINGQIKTPEINTADLIIRNIPDIINSLMRDGLNIGYLSVSLRDGGSKGDERVYDDVNKTDDGRELNTETPLSSTQYHGYISIFV